MFILKQVSWTLIIFSILLCPLNVAAAESGDEKGDLEAFLVKLFNERTHLLIDQRPESIAGFYEKTDKISQYAYKQELLRSQYIHRWAEKRGVAFTDASSEIRVIRVKRDGDQVKVSLTQTLKLSYLYKGESHNPQSFGIGTRHVMRMKKHNGEWLVLREYYSDPLTENPKLIPESDGFPSPTFSNIEKDNYNSGSKDKRGYNRERAVEYANKYAGLAWGAGNNHRYNKNYLDYTHQGGDCTNFASQVLGDKKEGGGLRMRSGWAYREQGSQTWVQTDSFKNFILNSGYGKLVAKGYFTDVVKPTGTYPGGAVKELKPGDLIAYELKEGDVDHFCILVGFDDHGYPLVNSHSADRFRVPFDLGWDKNTRYLLIHIND